MAIVPVSALSPSDLALLGNNVRPSRRPARRAPSGLAKRRVLAAVNRALAPSHERVDQLDCLGRIAAAPSAAVHRP